MRADSPPYALGIIPDSSTKKKILFNGNPCILMSTATARISIIPYHAIDLYMETDRYTYPSIFS
jgi:hypothetical protein